MPSRYKIMTKKDRFVATYSSVWIFLIVVLTSIVYTNKLIDTITWVLICNITFLTITASFVFIEPIRDWVDNHIISKF